MPCYSPLKGWKSLETGGIVFKQSQNTGAPMEVPCSSCLGCRLDHSRMWAMRITHEACLHDNNCFITLTYDDEHLPGNLSISKTELQLFNKKLRNRHGKFRFFAVGEYGSICPTHEKPIGNNPGECRQCNLGRPHYHAILFNTDFDDKKIVSIREGIPLYNSEELDRIWGKGFTTIGAVNFESAAYCARYSLKKIKGERADDHYQVIDKYGEHHKLTPEFNLMSRGYTCEEHRGLPYQLDCPKCSRGLGADWYHKYVSDIFPSDDIPIPGRGVFKKVPRYYETQFKETDPDVHEDIKRLRQAFRAKHADDYTPERLMAKYKVKRKQIQLLKRDAQ